MNLSHMVAWTKLVPALMVLVMGSATFFWTRTIGMSWQGPGLDSILLAISWLLAISLFAYFRGAPKLAEIAAFIFLYLLFPILGVRLSYLVTTVQFPLIDDALARFDLALGFHWQSYAAFIASHPIYHGLTYVAYQSPVAQAIMSVVIFGLCRPGSRNFETLSILSSALLITILLYMLFPAVGPEAAFGVENSISYTIRELRAGHITLLLYTGIVSFPSYHTIMAIVFTYAHRGIKGTAIPVAALNFFMLLGVPFYGDHYVADMCGGAVIAAACIAANRKFCMVPARPAHPAGGSGAGQTAPIMARSLG